MTEPKKLESYVREMLDHGTSEDEPIDEPADGRTDPKRLWAPVCRNIGIGLMLVGLLLILGAVFVLLFQGLLWLRDGQWPGWQVRLVWYALELPTDPLTWLGVEKIRTWTLDLPIAGVLAPTGMLGIVAGAAFTVQAETYEMDKSAERTRRKAP
jgi:hypothetical protein